MNRILKEVYGFGRIGIIIAVVVVAAEDLYLVQALQVILTL